ncbi:macro domain-containing protein [Aquisphaera insulae]|uniref:macro domain-containing protein n=1 Tax=Aquisphaera insulae TaxID=2712864 RepID=UPI0013EC9E87|nr:macro domain-containing protein [Aquisphaera insulae]
MPIEFVAGDLFANAANARALAHGCNCQGSMGAGVARGFRERYPEMYEQFRARCKAVPRQFNLGDAWLWKDDRRPWVFNLGTQEAFWHARASYEAIETALGQMRVIADAEGIDSIAMPRIGVGYGGLSWKKVEEILGRVLGEWPGRAIVYETYVAAEPSPDPSPGDRPAVLPGPRRSIRGKRPPRFRGMAVTIACRDQDRTAAFYETVLGAVPIPTDNGIGRHYRLGSLRLNLLPNAEASSPASFPEHAQLLLWIEVDDLARAAEHLAAHAVEIVDAGDGQFLTIADPDGLVIEVWERSET